MTEGLEFFAQTSTHVVTVLDDQNRAGCISVALVQRHVIEFGVERLTEGLPNSNTTLRPIALQNISEAVTGDSDRGQEEKTPVNGGRLFVSSDCYLSLL